jgi:hypothetical protein
MSDNKITEKQYDILTSIFSFNWSSNLTTKKYGSVADIYLERVDDIGYKNFMLIDDGSIDVSNATYHIYADEGLKDKIFEGRIETVEELEVVMKVLGYDKNND